jgi:hypothetical protein
VSLSSGFSERVRLNLEVCADRAERLLIGDDLLAREISSASDRRIVRSKKM